MLPYFTENDTAAAIPIWPVNESAYPAWRKSRSAAERQWLRAVRFKPRPGKWARLPGPDGRLAGVVVGVADPCAPWDFAKLPKALMRGNFRVEGARDAATAHAAAVGWGLGTYEFTRYRAKGRSRFATLVVPRACDPETARRVIAATFFVRDLVNTPASDMGPADLADAAADMGRPFHARTKVTVGEALLERNLPAIHAVGRASDRAPRLIDLRWGARAAPRLTLVGKGVCFDSGGLDIKTHTGMKLMKKDMGGAAHVLALAHMIMDAGLPVRLRVLIPAVDNAISGSAMRPGDVVPTRKGLHIEIGHTDAEGRVVLADALALADEDSPDLIVDCATLTGAARVALGTGLTPFFTDDDAFASQVVRAGESESDPVWRLPLWKPYERLIESSIADINNSGDSRFGGALTAALFLRSFVTRAKAWAHFDMYAWNSKSRPGRPAGGEATGLRTLFTALRARYG
ncbi:MAG TPA: leucyl aminopeptidase family protein [Alphaproteobacteria bacterium]|nr:leucyl aminopeptidase family protein [Alphaproteobacteria bacterium]